MRQRILSITLVFVMIFSLTACGDSSKHEGEAKTPSGSSVQKGRNYLDVVNNFEEKGFTNIKTEVLGDLVTGWMTKDGEVESVSVDGDKKYSADVWYPNDVKVIITYHTFSKETADSKDKTEQTQQPVKSTDKTDGDSKLSKSTPDTILTVENNEDLAAVLLTKNESDPIIKEFAEKYTGKTIEFDGNITSVNNHDNYKTRYDILILTGDYNENHAVGPNFRLSDVGVSDLGIKDLYLPKFINTGNNIHIIAKIKKYNEISSVFELDPISIRTR